MKVLFFISILISFSSFAAEKTIKKVLISHNSQCQQRYTETIISEKIDGVIYENITLEEFDCSENK